VLGGGVMSKNRVKKIAVILVSPFLGFVAYFISGILANVVPGNRNSVLLFLCFLISGGLGALLLALFFRMRQKIIRMVIAGVVAWPLGVILGMLIGLSLIRIPIAFLDFW
jgi:Na+/citrate or Na+/malate symporter